MPPNLGGFFMVRSYYPSECHADYFDFERIEALKPAIEACGISTLSQSPMLGFHKQMDNRIKLLEERSEERFSRNAETDLVCRLLLEKKNVRFRLGSLAITSSAANWIWRCAWIRICCALVVSAMIPPGSFWVTSHLAAT